MSIRRTITKSGGLLLLGEPKTAKSRRTITLTTGSLNALRAHRKRQLEEMMQRTGLWQDHGLVFASEAGTLINPPTFEIGTSPRYSSVPGYPPIPAFTISGTRAPRSYCPATSTPNTSRSF